MSANPVYRFIRVEDYFRDYQTWDRLQNVTSCTFDDSSKTVSVVFGNKILLIQFLKEDIVRVRFNPHKHAREDYPEANTRRIVQDQFSQLREDLGGLTVRFQDVQEGWQVTTFAPEHGKDTPPELTITIINDPFQIVICRTVEGRLCQVWKTHEQGVYFTPNGTEDFSIIQAVCKPAAAKYIGFGEQGGRSLSKNTAQLTYFNYDNYAYRNVYGRGPLDNREPLYHSDPCFMEFNGIPGSQCTYALFVDNYGETCMDIGHTNSGRYMFGTRFGDLDYYLFFANSAPEAVRRFTSVVGRTRLPPRYALGYHQGCYGYEHDSDLYWVVKKYREHQIPLDGLHIDVDLQKNYQTFTINETNFPNPKAMFDTLRLQGVKCSTNITPIISNTPGYPSYDRGMTQDVFVRDTRVAFEPDQCKCYQDFKDGRDDCVPMDDHEQNYNSGNPYIGEVHYGKDRSTRGHYADLARKEVRIWWGQQYQYLFDCGLDMVWQDMTTPAIRNTRGDMKGFPFRLNVSDDSLSALLPDGVEPDAVPKTAAIKIWNLYSYNLHKATYHGLNHLRGRENKRNFIIGRGSATGMHRFAALWTGDNASNWDFLRMNIAQVLSLGISGQPISGQDIGGFATDPNDSNQRWVGPELLMRWTIAGAFLPWFRNHYVRKDNQKFFQEPFQYQEWFHNNPPDDSYGMVVKICKHYIELRYRLLQLFYDALFESTMSGMPISRPLFLNDPEDQALYNDKINFLDDQLFVGHDLLAAPIIEPENVCQGKRSVYLPANFFWYTFMDNCRALIAPVEGGSTITEFDAHLDKADDHIGFVIPLFVREGAIIPTVELEQFVGERQSKGLLNPVTINIYPAPSMKHGESRAYNLYLDDGVSRDSAPDDLPQFRSDTYAASKYRKVEIVHRYQDAAKKQRAISLKRAHDGYTPAETFFFVAILHDPSEMLGPNGPLSKVNVDGQDVPPITGGSASDRAYKLNAAISNSWYYNETINISFLKVFDSSLTTILADYV